MPDVRAPSAPEPPRVLPLALPLGALAVLAACVGVNAVHDPHPLGAALVEEGGVRYAAVGLVHALLTGVALRRRASPRLTATALVFTVLWTGGALLRLVVRHTGSLSPWLLWPLDVSTFTATLSTTVLLLVFPDGRLLPGAWRVAGRCSFGFALVSSSVLVVTSTALTPSPSVGTARPAALEGADPTVVPWLGDLLAPWRGPVIAVALVFFAIPVLSAAERFRRSTGAERDRMRWVAWGAAVLALTTAGAVVLGAGTLVEGVLYAMVATNAAVMALALLDPRWVSIEDLLVRTLVDGGLALVLVPIDLAAVAGLTAVLDDALAEQQVVLLVLLVSVVVYAPLRERLAGRVRHLVRGDAGTPYDVVAGLAAGLESAHDGTTQLAQVAQAAARGLGVRFVSVEVERADGERLVASVGERPAETRSLPIHYRGAEVGRLVLPAHGLRARLDHRQERLLGDLVRQAATFARTSELAEQLQRSRERLVLAREEERRRIRRDLHDELGPRLGGVVFSVESATLLAEREPGRAGELVSRTREQLQELVADVRRVVHDLRPPVLDDRGLVGALRQHVEHLDADGLEVDVRAEDLGTLPAAVEVAAYRIAVAALDNVVRHAGARRCTVALRRADGALLVEVADDGRGVDPDVQSGAGLAAVRERAAELGGRVEVVCPVPGGTTVRATLPVGER